MRSGLRAFDYPPPLAGEVAWRVSAKTEGGPCGVSPLRLARKGSLGTSPASGGGYGAPALGHESPAA
jgi:hypothetical protein